MRVIEARGIEKSYGGKKVLKAVDLDLDSGQLTVLGGLNGSGKSTIIKILSGDISPDNGEIVFDGKRVELRSIVDARHIGISAVYQEYMLVPDLTIAENIFLGSGKFSISRKKMNQESSRLLKEVGLEYEPSAKVSSLSADDQSLLEFAIAAFSEPKVLLIDDLFSVLNSSYKERLLKMINDVKNRGASVLVATPDPEIMQKADRLFFIENSTVVDLPVPL
ncbi:MAG TPA: ABC transporter, partial [Mesotoga sp.]|nr:ABC transporter [Mesotoga sp.]